MCVFMFGFVVLVLLVSEVVCYVFFNVSFYWLLLIIVVVCSFDGWLVNLGDWYLLFFGMIVFYVVIGVVFYVLVSLFVCMVDGLWIKFVG